MSFELEQSTDSYLSSTDEEASSEQTSEEESEDVDEIKNPRKRTVSDRELGQFVSGFDSSSDDADEGVIHVVGKLINF